MYCVPEHRAIRNLYLLIQRHFSNKPKVQTVPTFNQENKRTTKTFIPSDFYPGTQNTEHDETMLIQIYTGIRFIWPGKLSFTLISITLLERQHSRNTMLFIEK